MTRLILAITFLVLVIGSCAGYWMTGPIDAEDYAVVMPRLVTRASICDFQKGYGFLVPPSDRIYLAAVTSIPWRCLPRSELEGFMDGQALDTCFYGGITVRHESGRSVVNIDNWPVASRRFTGVFLGGGSTTFSVYRRRPSLLTLLFGRYDIQLDSQLVS
jgi:hypothetical protein